MVLLLEVICVFSRTEPSLQVLKLKDSAQRSQVSDLNVQFGSSLSTQVYRFLGTCPFITGVGATQVVAGNKVCLS